MEYYDIGTSFLSMYKENRRIDIWNDFKIKFKKERDLLSISLTRTICNLFPRLQTSSIYCFNVASGHDPGQEANLEKTYLRKNKASKGKIKKILLVHGPTLQTKHT